jgi:hypothetical protein
VGYRLDWLHPIVGGGSALRYFIVWRPEYADNRPFVVDETIGEDEDEVRRICHRAPSHALVLTRAQLLSEEWGRQAYLAWRSGDDSRFEEVTRRGLADMEVEDEAQGFGRPALRLVT